ncbi:MAG: helix-turn-helix domain-containing protein [Nannocystis sp.]|uniref:helix-turn-helix domain-containing protein n=1 Tax=Nannocystis sp. TaxID=1962667 RepID=UPI002428E76D|nr:helix-turn-helix domain-containing protein [Nannocystis sp.]MBK9755760.1 helix-turn-helix domain-containing protein [Nannocystis sp.]
MNSQRRQYLSTAQAAELLGVGPTSVKRWADLGLLGCVRTAGNHRRFTHDEVERFARAVQAGQIGLQLPPAPPRVAPAAHVTEWTDRLLALGPVALHDALRSERQALGAWWRVADRVGAALHDLGERWLCGEISVIDEHLASERLTRALARCGEGLPTPHGAPLALLAAATGEEHTLGLALAEVVLREAGYTVEWIGRHTPGEYLAAHLRRHRAALVGLTASQCLQDAASLRVAALPIAEACQAMGTRLILGGAGRWPADIPAAERVHDFDALQALLADAA